MIVLSDLDMIWQEIPASGSTVLERFPIQLSIVHFYQNEIVTDPAQLIF